MRASSSVALTFVALLLAGPLLAGPKAEPMAQFIWEPEYDQFGGLSGLEVSGDGTSFVAVSDDGTLYRGTFLRDENDTLQSATLTDVTPLVIETGTRPDKKRYRDMEGLAQDAAGALYISAEHNPRILSYVDVSGTPTAHPLPRLEGGEPKNVGFEAIALSPEEQFVVMREGSANIRAGFPIFRRAEDGRWNTIFELPRQGGFRPVGADFGPDGHLYILTRAFNGFAFAVNIDRVLFEENQPITNERLFSGKFGDFDNLEGLAVWRDADENIRLTAVSDDNFSRIQATIFVEFRLQE